MGELGLLLPQTFLEIGELLLPPLQLVLADLDVGFAARFARLELGLAGVELVQPVAEGRLGVRQPLLAPLEPLSLRLDDVLGVRELGLALDELRSLSLSRSCMASTSRTLEASDSTRATWVSR